MSNKAGRILLIPRGNYNPNIEYHMLDFVKFQGNSYVAKGTTLGNLPTDTDHWQAMTDIENIKYVTPQMFGAKADGITDDWAAINAAFQHSKNVYFPSGTYRVEKKNERIALSGEVHMIGDGADESIINFIDTEDGGKSLFEGEADSITIKDMCFNSTFTELNYSRLNTAQLLYLTSAKVVDIENCSFNNWRANCMSSAYTEKVTLIGNRYYKIGRDANRFLEAYDTYVVDCDFELCGDDIVSFHNTSQTNEGKHVFSGNKTELAHGCGYLGCSNVFITNNTFNKARKLFTIGISSAGEGKKSNNIYFADNVVYPINLDAEGSQMTDLMGECNNIYIKNNDFLYSEPHEESIIIGWNAVYENVNTYPYAIILYGHNIADTENLLSNVYIENNRFMSKCGVSATGRHNVKYISFSSVTTGNVVVKNNVFYDGLNNNMDGNTSDYVIEHNIFDCDPNNVIATDGIFATSTACRPLPNNSPKVKYNDFYNVSGDYFEYGDGNRLHADIMDSNKGCNPIRLGAEIRYTIIPYDYANKKDRNDVLLEKSAMPSSGYYAQGHYVRKLNPRANGVLGWVRLTNGNEHVLGTDWAEIKVTLVSA